MDAYPAVTEFPVRHICPAAFRRFEVRFETGPGKQGRGNFAHYHVVLADEPIVPCIVWLSRWRWASVS
jgi:hypothetical protein